MIRRLNNHLKRFFAKEGLYLRTHSFRIGVINRVTQEFGIEQARELANRASVATTQIYLRTNVSERKANQIISRTMKAPS